MERRWDVKSGNASTASLVLCHARLAAVPEHRLHIEVVGSQLDVDTRARSGQTRPEM